MPIAAERIGEIRARQTAEGTDGPDIDIVIDTLDRVYAEAKIFALNNNLRRNLGSASYDLSSREEISGVMRNAIAIHLLSVRLNRERSFSQKLKERFAPENKEELREALTVLRGRTGSILQPQGMPDHFLGTVNASINSLLDNMHPLISKQLGGAILLDEETVRKWGDHWRPLIKDLGVGRIAERPNGVIIA